MDPWPIEVSEGPFAAGTADGTAVEAAANFADEAAADTAVEAAVLEIALAGGKCPAVPFCPINRQQ